MGASSLSFHEGPPGATLLEALPFLPGPIPERIPQPARGTDARPAALTHELWPGFPLTSPLSRPIPTSGEPTSTGMQVEGNASCTIGAIGIRVRHITPRE